MSGLSSESLNSLSSAVGLEGTGTPFRSPSLYQLVIAILATSIRSFTDVRFHGLSRIPRKGPVIVVCNHVSNLAPIFMVQATRAVDVLDAGRALGIFPEGTRSRRHEPPYLQQGKTGIARLAARFPDVPLVTMVVIGTQDMMRPGSKLVRPWKKVEVNIDETITFAQWAASEQGGGLSDGDIGGLSKSEEEMGNLYRRFTDQLIETMRLMGAP